MLALMISRALQLLNTCAVAVTCGGVVTVHDRISCEPLLQKCIVSPLQGVPHGSLTIESPPHGFPPFWGTGLMQPLTRV